MGLITRIRNRLSWLRHISGQLWDRYILKMPPRSLNPYATHLPILMAVGRLRPVRRVLELGCGRHSTLAFLNRMAFPDLVSLHSLEDDRTWAETISNEVGNDPRFNLMILNNSVASAVSSMDLSLYDLILVDDSANAAQRVDTIGHVLRNCPRQCIVAIHDYEVPQYRQVGRLTHHFRFTCLCPNTGVLWHDAGLSIFQLRRISAVIRVHAGAVMADDIASWATILDGELCSLFGH